MPLDPPLLRPAQDRRRDQFGALVADHRVRLADWRRAFSLSCVHNRRAADTSSPPSFGSHVQNVAELTPWRRQTSALGRPPSCSIKIAMVCSSLTLNRFVSARFLGV